MRYLKLFESFEDIDGICKKFGIKNYTINTDGTIDFNGDMLVNNLNLNARNFEKLPLKFNKVTGNFFAAVIS